MKKSIASVIFASVVLYIEGCFKLIEKAIGKRSYETSVNAKETKLGRKSSLIALRKIDAVIAKWIEVENYIRAEKIAKDKKAKIKTLPADYALLDIQSGSAIIAKMTKLSDLYGKRIAKDEKGVLSIVDRTKEQILTSIRKDKVSFKDEMAKAKGYSDSDIKLISNLDLSDAAMFRCVKIMARFNAKLTEYVAPTIKVKKANGTVKVTNIDAKALRLKAKADKAKTATATATK